MAPNYMCWFNPSRILCRLIPVLTFYKNQFIGVVKSRNGRICMNEFAFRIVVETVWFFVCFRLFLPYVFSSSIQCADSKWLLLLGSKTLTLLIRADPLNPGWELCTLEVRDWCGKWSKRIRCEHRSKIMFE